MMQTLSARNTSRSTVLATNVRVADTHLTRGVGLLGRKGLAPGEALWIVPCHGVHTWGMRFSIDVLALDAEGRVVGMAPDTPAWRMRLFGRRATASVLELAAGVVAGSGTQLGDRIAFERAGEEIGRT